MTALKCQKHLQRFNTNNFIFMKNLFFTFAFLLIGTLSFAKSANVKVLSQNVKVLPQTLKNDSKTMQNSTVKSVTVGIYCNGVHTANVTCDGCSVADFIGYALDICG